MCCIGALIILILNSLHHEVVRDNSFVSSNSRIPTTYIQIHTTLHYTTLHYTTHTTLTSSITNLLKCNSQIFIGDRLMVESSSQKFMVFDCTITCSGSGSGGGGSGVVLCCVEWLAELSIIILLQDCICVCCIGALIIYTLNSLHQCGKKRPNNF